MGTRSPSLYGLEARYLPPVQCKYLAWGRVGEGTQTPGIMYTGCIRHNPHSQKTRVFSKILEKVYDVNLVVNLLFPSYECKRNCSKRAGYDFPGFISIESAIKVLYLVLSGECVFGKDFVNTQMCFHC